MTSPSLHLAFVPLGSGAPFAVRRAAPRLADGRPARRSVAAAQPHRRAAQQTIVANATEPGDRKLDGDEVVVASAASGNVAEEEDTRSEKQKEIDRLKAAEKFIEVDEGNFECPTCSYVYEKSKGEFLSGVKSGTEFDDLPSDFTCPSCKTPKSAFQPIKKVIAGFADNQSYGFGTNSLTGGQKSALIYGGLAVFFLLFLSGT
eukprot:TRINITY_DN3042_c0_g1_i1.p1 TRINITY_DN3042_c0_g1~~TRINITY_DN3042_c0_g1_i1.p1  ORF type:complete len:232 (-),score=60.34 TRINITY_DN3042_c0_g1_i1:359-967(-)